MSRIVHRNLHAYGGGGGSGVSKDYSASFRTRKVPSVWATETLWVVTVEGVKGAPTAASIRPRFEITRLTGRNSLEELSMATAQDFVWTPLNGADHRSLLPDGDWGEIATQAVGAPTADGANSLTVAKRIVGGFWHAVYFDIAFTGGASPAFQLTIESFTKGG